MNAIALINNQNAQYLAAQQSAMDTTAPVVDMNRPEAALIAQGPDWTVKGKAGNAAYHLLFVVVFLFGGIALLGTITGELELRKAPNAII